MKAMIYVIRFEEELDLGDIDCYLKEIKSHIRLEIGDKIALSFASFDRSLEDDEYRIVELMGYLLEKSIYPSKYRASFEISDITYIHEYYYDDDDYDDGINFYGAITLKGK
jgi:hypothetical protein